MDVINVGSLNIDLVYEVPHFVSPGETTAATHFSRHVGGKGLNQSIALARAGLGVMHVGAVGEDGDCLLNMLEDAGVDTSAVQQLSGASGHASIQVTPQGQNAIIIHAGTNASLNKNNIDDALAHSDAKALLIQNETNLVPYAIRAAKQRGMKVFYNPAPMLPEVLGYPIDAVDVLIVNEHEAQQLTRKDNPADQLKAMRDQWPHLTVVMTRGAEGVIVCDNTATQTYPAIPVALIKDTTGAGDTFIGYFIAACLQGCDLGEAAQQGMRAASLCISRSGASESIPTRKECDAISATT